MKSINLKTKPFHQVYNLYMIKLINSFPFFSPITNYRFKLVNKERQKKTNGLLLNIWLSLIQVANPNQLPTLLPSSKSRLILAREIGEKEKEKNLIITNN